jgi:hypothetical protein
VTLIAAVAIVVAAAGCGHSSSSRAQLARYLTQVNGVEATFSKPLAAVTSAGSALTSQLRSGPVAKGSTASATEATLMHSVAQIYAGRGRLAALAAPAPARHLRALLLTLAADQARMTQELAKLVVYLPRFNAVLSQLRPAVAGLGQALSRSATGASAVSALYATKAAALRRFQLAAEAVAARLRTLAPPAVSKPGYEAQVRSLRGMATSAGQLATALSTGALASVPGLLAAFDRAATASRSRAVQLAQIAAVRAYDAQTKELTRLQGAISRERLRLDNTVH